MIQIGSREQHVHPKPVQKYGSHKQSVQKSVHPKPTIMIQISSFNSQKQSMQIFYIAKSNSQINNLLTFSHMTNYPNFFISFTMQKYFEIATIKVQLPKYYHVAYNIISVTVCVSVNNNKS